MGKGGGSAPAPSTQTVQQSNIPEYARPYFEDIMTRGTTASNVQYQPYTGERVAPFTPMQQQAFEGVQNLGPSPLIGAGAGLTGLAAGQAAQASQYQPMAPQQTYQAPQFQGMGLEYLSTQAPNLQQYQMGPAERVQGAQTGAAQTNYNPNLQTFQMGPAERARTGSFARPGTAEAYMSPYMQNVVDVQQREAQRQADIARTQRGAQAVGVGAFGGSRQAIMEAEAARNLATQKGDIQAQGLQSAYQQAQQAYQTDAQRQLQANLANQQAGLTVGGQNLQSALGVQQLGAQTGLQTSLANQQARQQAMMANQQMRQQANLANQQAGLTTGQQNLQALLQTQGLGAQTGMQSQQLNQAAQLQAQQQALGQSQAANQFAQQNAQLAAQYGLAGLQAGEQSRQFGANLGLQGAGMLGQLGGQFGQLGQTGFGQQAAALEAQQRAGAMQQAQGQQQRDIGYEEFMRQQLYPQSQLQFLSSLLRGSVVAPQQTMYTYQQQPSAISQIGGLGLGALGLSQAFGRKDGGEIKGYADGGVTGGDPKAQGVTPSRVTNVKKQLLAGVDPRKIPDPLGVMLALQDRDFVKQLELTSAAKNQQALDGGRQQAPSVYDEEMGKVAAGIGGVDAGVMEDVYAGGGIVAFQYGGSSMGAEMGEMGEMPEQEVRRKPTPEEVDATIAARRARGENLGLAQILDIQSGDMGLPATLPQPVTAKPAPVVAQQKPPVQAAPNTQQIPAAPVKRTAAPATPAATPGQSIKPETSLLYTEETPEAAFARKEAEMEKRFPSELKDRLEDLKAQGQQAVKDRDADRWLAVAMGGFAAAAGQSPYALQNFAQGLGITTKEMRGINKDFRKAEDLRKQIEREERKANRLEGMQKYDVADKARTRVEDITRDAQKADAMYKAKLEELAIKRTGLDIEREKVKASREGTAAYREAALESRNITAFNSAVQKEKDSLQKSLGMMSATPEQIEQQAIRNVITRNPKFAGLAGVSATETPTAPTLPKGVKVTRE
jgi:hypothetical protein